MLKYSWGPPSLSPRFPWSIRSLGNFLHALPSQTVYSLPSSRSSPLAILRARSVRVHPPLTLFALHRSPNPDTAFWDGLGVSNWVPKSQRGYVEGTASNVPSSYSDKIVVAWNNSNSQYWYVPRTNHINQAPIPPAGPVPTATGLSLHLL
jgi:hypothetical protein